MSINPNRQIKGLSEIRDARYPLNLNPRMESIADMMQELETRLNSYTQQETDELYAQLDEIEAPSEEEINEMYSARDLEDIASDYCRALNDSF